MLWYDGFKTSHSGDVKLDNTATNNCSWFTDHSSIEQNGIGIVHSYAASLATVLLHINSTFDPVWFMGVSTFAFRIQVNEILCPSAMSVFDWRTILPKAVELTGFECQHISRMWEEGDKEQEKRAEAHQAILRGLDNGIPAVVWDVHDTEWGVITGFDSRNNCYQTLTNEGTPQGLFTHNIQWKRKHKSSSKSLYPCCRRAEISMELF